MAKLYFDGVCVMHDVAENVKQAAALCPASINVYTEEEQAQIRRAQAIEAARETPDYVKANLGIL